MKKRKKIQRRLNKVVRDLNKSIESDEIWLGRFYVRQVSAQRSYEDELFVVFEFVDKKTGKKIYRADHSFIWSSVFGGYNLGREMNDFIVEHVCVWKEDPQPGSKEWYENIDW